MKDQINPEEQYPELKTMRSSEMFIEWAYVVKKRGVTKLHIKQIIPKKERPVFIKLLKLEYNIAYDPYSPYDNEEVELITIFK